MVCVGWTWAHLDNQGEKVCCPDRFPRGWQWGGGVIRSPGTFRVTRQHYYRVFGMFQDEGSPIRHLEEAGSVASLAAGRFGVQQDGKDVVYVYHSKCGDNGYSRVRL